MSIRIEVSCGELIDKITILEIKAVFVKDPVKLANVRHELKRLADVRQSHIVSDPLVDALTTQLSKINRALWEVEDKLRDREREKNFDDVFVELARSVYRLNDERAHIKRELNTTLKSEIVEEKNYCPY